MLRPFPFGYRAILEAMQKAWNSVFARELVSEIEPR